MEVKKQVPKLQMPSDLSLPNSYASVPGGESQVSSFVVSFVSFFLVSLVSFVLFGSNSLE